MDIISISTSQVYEKTFGEAPTFIIQFIIELRTVQQRRHKDVGENIMKCDELSISYTTSSQAGGIICWRVRTS